MTDENKTQHDLLSIDCMIPNPGNSDAVFSVTAKGLNRLALSSSIFQEAINLLKEVEWIEDYHDQSIDCFWCGRPKSKHDDDCRYKLFMDKLEEVTNDEG